MNHTLNNNQEELIERVKAQTEQLWNTIQEAKKSDIKIEDGFNNFSIRPELKILKVLY